MGRLGKNMNDVERQDLNAMTGYQASVSHEAERLEGVSEEGG